MARVRFLQMKDGHIFGACLQTVTKIAHQQKTDPDFAKFVQVNRKILRISTRIFKKQFINLFFFISNSHSKKKLLSIYTYKRTQILTKHKHLIFFLLYMQFGFTINLKFIQKYLRHLSRNTRNFSDSDGECKLILWLFYNHHFNILKFESTTGSVGSKCKNNFRKSHLHSPIIHEALMYKEVSQIIPSHTIHCVCYGTLFNNDSSVLFHETMNTKHLQDFNLSNADRNKLWKLLEYNSKSTDGMYNFVITNYLPGYTTYLAQLKYLKLESIRRIFDNTMEQLHVLHKHRIYHSDLHLNNLLCDIDGNIKFFDYDLSSCLPDLDSRILFDYEFNHTHIQNTFKFFDFSISDEKLLSYIDFFYVVFIIDMHRHIKQCDASVHFKGKLIYDRFDICDRLLSDFYRSKKKKFSEFTHRAILAGMIFHEPFEYIGNGESKECSSDSESNYSESESAPTCNSSNSSQSTYETCSD